MTSHNAFTLFIYVHYFIMSQNMTCEYLNAQYSHQPKTQIQIRTVTVFSMGLIPILFKVLLPNHLFLPFELTVMYEF